MEKADGAERWLAGIPPEAVLPVTDTATADRKPASPAKSDNPVCPGQCLWMIPQHTGTETVLPAPVPAAVIVQ